jgi:hypothetical protein
MVCSEPGGSLPLGFRWETCSDSRRGWESGLMSPLMLTDCDVGSRAAAQHERQHECGQRNSGW